MYHSFGLVVFLFVCTTSTVEATNTTGVPGKWTQCIGDQIAKCLSCVAEDAIVGLATVLEAAKREPETTVGVLLSQAIKGAFQCVQTCSAASTQLVAQQCSTSWYCRTDFCVVCCGQGSWQCLGNDWTPQCAPKTTESEKFFGNGKKFGNLFEKSVEKTAERAGDSVEECRACPRGCGSTRSLQQGCCRRGCTRCCRRGSVEEVVEEVVEDVANDFGNVVDKVAEEAEERLEEVVAEVMNSMGSLNVSAGIEKCQCGPGSGDPDSCCSKCQPSPDKHNVPHCPGGGMNTGPFCGNDFHVTEPNACYGDTPLCCTNDMGIPVCCRKGQVCHSPLTGDNECRDPVEAVVV